jgi:hypothetical protein
MLEYISFDELLLTVGSHSAPIGVVGGIHLFLVVSGFWSVRFFLASSGTSGKKDGCVTRVGSVNTPATPVTQNTQATKRSP